MTVTNIKKIVSPFLNMSKWTFLTVSFRSLMVIGVNKITALTFGSSGIAILSHFQNLISIFTQIADQGTNTGIIREYNQIEKSNRSTLISNSIFINLIIYVALIGLFLLFKDFTLKQFSIEGFSFLWILSFLVSVLFIILNSISLSILYAERAFKLLTAITIIDFIILISVFSLSISQNNISISLIAFSVGYAINGFLNFLILRVKGYFPLDSFKFDKKLSKNLWTFILMAGASVFFGKFTDFMVRDFAISWFGIHDTGLWQSQVKISESYRSVYQGTFGVIAFASMSKLAFDKKSLKKYLRGFLLFSFSIAIIGLLTVYVFRFEFIHLLFSKGLFEAADFIEYQLIADVFGISCFPLVYMLMIDKRTVTYIYIHFVSAVIYLFCIVVLIAIVDLSIISIPLANAIRMSMFFVILVYLNRKMLFNFG